MKNTKVIFWVSTGLVSAMMLMSAGMYLLNFDEVSQIFVALGYPTFVIKPLAIAKILGVIAIVSRKSATLQQWAYAGFFFDFLLAVQAHVMAKDGEHWPAAAALALLLISVVYSKKM